MTLRAAVCAAGLLVAQAASGQDVNDEVKHPSLRLGAVRLELLARVQMDARASRNDDARREDEGDGVDIAKKRITTRGRVARVAAFEIEAELQSDDPWRDVYLEYRQFRAVRVRAGHFKTPFSLDYTTSSANLDFLDRARVTERLSAGRDQGVMAHGRVWRDRLKYEVGAFEDGRMTAVRLTSRPWGARRSAAGRLAAAVAFTRGTLDERRVDSIWVNGTRQRTGLELRWQPGPFTVTSEYMRAADERRGQGMAGEDLAPLVRTGWYLTGTWTMAGGNRPNVELAARAEGLRVGSGGPDASLSPRAPVVASRAERAVTLGVNWYVVPRAKLQVNGVRARVGTSRATWMPLVRLQVTL